MKKILLCITGASGALYGIRTMKAIIDAGEELHCIVSPWGERVVAEETGRPFSEWADICGMDPGRIYDPEDLSAPVSSGSFRLSGAAIVPCSMNTAGRIACGIGGSLIRRAALVCLKEGRPLVLVPRESPLSLPDLRNLCTLAESGAAILPASPGFYNHPETIDDLADFMAGKILDRLGIENNLFVRWKNQGSAD
jgi:4-hydroxy-3-polyprenylbenzoate decarboxylase